MCSFLNYFQRIIQGGALLGGGFLIGIMLLIVVNMFYRFLGGVIAGTYELVELMIVVSGAFSLGYTALKRGHITIGIIVSRVPQRIRIILERVTSAISLCLWTIMAWATFSIIHERWLREQSQLLQISYFPFRFALLLGLILFCIVILIDLFLAPHKEESK